MCCSVNGYVFLVCCVFVNCLVKQFAICLVKQFAICFVKQFAICFVKQFAICLVKQFAICLGVVVILLLNLMEVFSVGGGALLDRPSMVFHGTCVLRL